MKTAQNPGFGVHIEFVEVYVLLFWRSFLQKFFFYHVPHLLKMNSFSPKKSKNLFKNPFSPISW